LKTLGRKAEPGATTRRTIQAKRQHQQLQKRKFLAVVVKDVATKRAQQAL
jgi:hypothetical protein